MWRKGALPMPCGPNSLPKPHGLRKDTRSQKEMQMAATPGFKSQHLSSSAAPFLAPPTTGHSCQHSGQVWPCGVEPIISNLFWTPLQIPIWAPPLAAPCYKICHLFLREDDLGWSNSASIIFLTLTCTQGTWEINLQYCMSCL